MSIPAGISWCKQFPTSTSLEDLLEPFKTNCKNFINYLEQNGAKVTIATTYRPESRAFLMHYCCLVANGQLDPTKVPIVPGIDIEWTVEGAKEMMRGYGIIYPAALVSEHTKRLAIDMDITGFNLSGRALWDLGATYGVHKLPSDPPHWSSTGN